MNTLSMLIYLVGVVDPISSLAFWLLIPGMIGSIGVIIAWIVIGINEADEAYNSKNQFPDSFPKRRPYDSTSYDVTWKWWRKTRNAMMLMATVGWTLYLFVPSRQTLILIAGSEIGGKVMQSEAVQSVVDPGLDLVKTWIANETLKLKPQVKTNDSK